MTEPVESALAEGSEAAHAARDEIVRIARDLGVEQVHQACLKLKSSSAPTSDIEASTSLIISFFSNYSRMLLSALDEITEPGHAHHHQSR